MKSQRLTDSNGQLTAVVETDAWGGETDRSWGQWQQPQRFTSYLRDANEGDEAMHRRYNRWWSRFNQPDPSDGSYDLTDPQSFNRYSYVQNDPVNFVDPSGLNLSSVSCYMSARVFSRPDNEGGGTISWLDMQWVCVVTETWDTGSGDPPGIDDNSGGGQQTEREKQKEYDDCINNKIKIRDDNLTKARKEFEADGLYKGSAGAVLGGVGGAALGGPPGALLGSVLMGTLGGVGDANYDYQKEKGKIHERYQQDRAECDKLFPRRPEIIQEENRKLMEFFNQALRLRSLPAGRRRSN